MFKFYYTTQMSRGARELKLRFERMRAGTEKQTRFVSLVLTVVILAAVVGASTVIAAADYEPLQNELYGLGQRTNLLRDAAAEKYYAETSKIDGAYLYIPRDADFAVQLPEEIDERFADNSDIGGSRLSYSGKYGSIQVIVSDEPYMSKSTDEMSGTYSGMFTGEMSGYKIVNIQFLRDKNGTEVGRSYEISSGEGTSLVYIRELKRGGGTVRVIAQPSPKREDISAIAPYADSFVMF